MKNRLVKWALVVLVSFLFGFFATSVYAGISRAGTLSTITGYKLDRTATGGGEDGNYAGALSYLADTGITGSVEENVTNSGTASGDQKYGSINTLEDDTLVSPNLMTERTSGGFLLESVTQGKMWPSAGYYDGDNVRITGATGTFSNGDDYRIHGFATSTPANWQQHYQWNILWIHTGTGAGQVRLIKCVTDIDNEARFWIYGGWETEPDNTSQYRVFYSPMDVVYANAAAGTITFDATGHIPLVVDITDEIQFGDGSTWTGFGYALLMMHLSDSKGSGTSDPTHLVYNKTYMFFGEFNPISETANSVDYKAQPAFMRGTNVSAMGNVIFGSPTGHSPNIRVYGSHAMGEFRNFYGVYYNAVQEAYFSNQDGYNRSYHNTVKPNSQNSEGVYFKYASVPLNNLPATVGNMTNTDVRAEWDGIAGHTTICMGRFWANQQAYPYNYWLKWVDSNYDLETYIPACGDGGEQIAWLRYEGGDFTDAIYWNKTINVEVVDEDGDAFQGCSVRIRNWGESYDQTFTTSASGVITEQELTIGYWSYDGHVVYHNGLYYTTKLFHKASASTEPGVGGSWTTYWNQAGSGEKIKWRIYGRYTQGYPTENWKEHSIVNYNPHIVDIDCDGYKPASSQYYDISMDSIGEQLRFEMYKNDLATVTFQ